MPRQILMNEIVFAVYRDRHGSELTVKMENAGGGDKKFLAAVARLIEIWMSAREASSCPKTKRRSA